MTTPPRRPRDHPASSTRGGDSGLTLLELVVTTTVMAIVLMIFTASVIAMYSATAKAEAIGHTSSQVTMAFNRLDGQLRYAADISAPGIGADGNWYVEWAGAHPDDPACTQLRLDAETGQLQQRTWEFDDHAQPQEISAWRLLAADLEPDPDTAPFTVPTAAPVPYQQLTVVVTAVTDTHHGRTEATSDITFTALNSHRAERDEHVCTEVGRS